MKQMITFSKGKKKMATNSKEIEMLEFHDSYETKELKNELGS